MDAELRRRRWTLDRISGKRSGKRTLFADGLRYAQRDVEQEMSRDFGAEAAVGDGAREKRIGAALPGGVVRCTR